MFVVLFALWLIFSGSVTVSNLILGAVVSGLLTFFCAKFMGYEPKQTQSHVVLLSPGRLLSDVMTGAATENC